MALFWLEGNKLLQMKNKIITLIITHLKKKSITVQNNDY